MNTSKGAYIGLAVQIIGLVTAPLVPIVALFARPEKDKEGRVAHFTEWGYYTDPRVDEYTQSYKARTLPRWLAWFDTPDQYLPGAMYEPTIRDFYLATGWYLTTVRWLLRNRMNGLSYRFALPAEQYSNSRKVERWVGSFLIEWGYEVKRNNRIQNHLDLVAVPCFSIKNRGSAKE